ncbi:MAG: hypothetical protein KC978_13090 [Candidatus Omnitrophica bacterium]|nr:hypothetical protein [Candidatus Omnitrophota bacterium]
MTETVETLDRDGDFTRALAPHFDSEEVQFSASKLGMWLFLGTEILLFGGLFCIYAIFRATHPEAFEYGHRYLDTNWGTINTLVLILSSFTVALAVRSAQCGLKNELVLFLSLTLLLGMDFLGVKTIEYTHKFHENLLWGKAFYANASLSEVSTVEKKEPETASLAPGTPFMGRKSSSGPVPVVTGRRAKACRGSDETSEVASSSKRRADRIWSSFLWRVACPMILSTRLAD